MSYDEFEVASESSESEDEYVPKKSYTRPAKYDFSKYTKKPTERKPLESKYKPRSSYKPRKSSYSKPSEGYLADYGSEKNTDIFSYKPIGDSEAVGEDFAFDAGYKPSEGYLADYGSDKTSSYKKSSRSSSYKPKSSRPKSSYKPKKEVPASLSSAYDSSWLDALF